MKDADRVFETRVPRSGPDPGNETELLDPFEAEKPLVGQNRNLGLSERNAVVQWIANGGCHRKSGSGGLVRRHELKDIRFDSLVITEGAGCGAG